MSLKKHNERDDGEEAYNELMIRSQSHDELPATRCRASHPDAIYYYYSSIHLFASCQFDLQFELEVRVHSYGLTAHSDQQRWAVGTVVRSILYGIIR